MHVNAFLNTKTDIFFVDFFFWPDFLKNSNRKSINCSLYVEARVAGCY